jgi:hypothetical protein
MVVTTAACGHSSGRPSGSRAAAVPSSSYRTDASDQVACSSRSLPWKYAGAVRFSASLEGVTAQFSATAVRQQYDQWLTDPKLTLAADGQRWDTTPKPAQDSFQGHYNPVEIDGPAHVSGYLCLVRFASGHVPPAVLTTYSGGAHCCTTVRLYDIATRHVDQLQLGNMGARITLVSGQPLIETHDDAFSYAFTDFADSGAPIRLYEPSSARFENVTRKFPALVRADARSLWNLAAKRVSKLGFYAAWAADEEMLGEDSHVWKTMRDLESAGKLTVPANLREPDWPDGKGYIVKLRSFLRDHGYLA